MIKKEYQKPTVKMAQLQHRHHILANSGVNGVQTLQGEEEVEGEPTRPAIWRELE